jgi:hypothetical protein
MKFVPKPCKKQTEKVFRFGRDLVAVRCVACHIPLGFARDENGAQEMYVKHTSIPAPSATVLGRKLTPGIVKRYSKYFINGPGIQIASRTYCDHEYKLTDSCPCCP